MKKAGAFILLLVFMSGIALAQKPSDEVKIGNDLFVKFHSFGKQASIDLKRYIGDADEYFFIASRNVTITIDQKNGIATIIANPSWEGVETIRFTTSKPAPLIMFREKSDEKIITDPDIAKVFHGLINNSFASIVSTLETATIRSIDARIEENQMIINLNDEAELFFIITEEKPETTLSILIPNKGPPKIAAFDVSRLNPYMIALLFIILVFIFRRQIKKSLFTTEIEIDLKSKLLTELIDVQRIEDATQREEELFRLIDRFFKIFGVKKGFTRIDLNRVLERRNIRGDQKQEIIYLASKFSDYENQDKEEIVKIFRSILGKL